MPIFSDDALKMLRNYHWPGNIRELEGMITDSVIRGRNGGVFASHIRDYLKARGVQSLSPSSEGGHSPDSPGKGGLFEGVETLPTLKDSANALVDEAMSRAGGNQSSAAQLLGITRTALNKRLSRRKEEES